MYRESRLQENIKGFLFGSAGITAFLNLIMLFTEFSTYSGLGMLFSGLYHLVAIACPALIFYLIFKQIENNEVYSNYAITLRFLLAGSVDFCVMGTYIKYAGLFNGISPWIIILCVICALIEIGTAVLFLQYGLDNLTPLLPIAAIVITSILRGATYNAVDSAMLIVGNTRMLKTFFTIWLFMDLFVFLVMVICLIMYFDSDFLSELLHDPKSIFTKNAVTGTFSNLYDEEKKKLRDEKKRKKEEKIAVKQASIQMAQQQMLQQQMAQSQSRNMLSYQPQQTNVPIINDKIIGICPDCESKIYEGQVSCSKCGCPASIAKPYIPSEVENNQNDGVTNNIISTDQYSAVQYMCPDCHTVIGKEQDHCPKCGCPRYAMEEYYK